MLRDMWGLFSLYHSDQLVDAPELRQLLLDGPEESLHLPVRHGVQDPREYLPYLVLHQVLLEDSQSPLPLLRLVGVELWPPVREDRGRPTILLDRLLEHLDRVLRC